MIIAAVEVAFIIAHWKSITSTLLQTPLWDAMTEPFPRRSAMAHATASGLPF